MSAFIVQDRGGRGRFVVTVSGLVTATLALGSVAAAIGCLLSATHRGPAWPALVVAFLALVTVILPDGWAALATQLAYGTWWLFAVRDVTTPWVGPAALAVLAFHVVVTHRASAPPGFATDPATVRGWGRDGVVVAGLTALAYAVVVVAHDAVRTASSIVGLTLLLVVLLLGVASRRPQPSTDA